MASARGVPADQFKGILFRLPGLRDAFNDYVSRFKRFGCILPWLNMNEFKDFVNLSRGNEIKPGQGMSGLLQFLQEPHRPVA